MLELKPLPCPASMNNGELLKLKHRFDDVCQSSTTPELFELCRAGSHLVDTIRSLPRALTWGDEPPKGAGFYWWICEQEQPDRPLMVLVNIDSAGKLSSFFIYGGEPSSHCCDKCRWAGPIVPPGE